MGRLPWEMSLIKVAGLCRGKERKEMRDPVPALADAAGNGSWDLMSSLLGCGFGVLGSNPSVLTHSLAGSVGVPDPQSNTTGEQINPCPMENPMECIVKSRVI